jgi:DNA-binding XRE family transcriptional regulator
LLAEYQGIESRNPSTSASLRSGSAYKSIRSHRAMSASNVPATPNLPHKVDVSAALSRNSFHARAFLLRETPQKARKGSFLQQTAQRPATTPPHLRPRYRQSSSPAPESSSTPRIRRPYSQRKAWVSPPSCLQKQTQAMSDRRCSSEPPTRVGAEPHRTKRRGWFGFVRLPMRTPRRRELHEECELSQARLADLSEIGRTQLSQIENGALAARIDTLNARANARALSLSEMLKGI